MMRRWRRILLGLPLLGALLSALPGSGTPSALAVPESIRDVPQVRVRLLESGGKQRLRGYDLRWSMAGRRPTGDRSTEWEVSCSQGRVEAHQVVGPHRGRRIQAVGFLKVDSPTGFMKWRGRGVRETLVIRAKSGERCEWVNELGVEKYLEGLVNAEFNSRWAPAAVDAQVIVARSYALHQRAVRRQDPLATYDLDSTVKDQVYEGPDREDSLGSQSVHRTWGQVLVAGKTAGPIKAFYHSTCGGHTELPQAVWGQAFPGVEKRVSCPFCLSSPRYRWSLDLSVVELERRLKAGLTQDPRALRSYGLKAGLENALKSAQLTRVVPGGQNAGRSSWVELTWSPAPGRPVSGPIPLRVPANRFREWVGFDQLRSTLFEVQWAASQAAPLRGGSFPIASAHAGNPLQVRFQGRGNGHGVGLCQWGAKTLGERGASAANILQTYYPGVSIQKLYSGR